MTDAEAEWWEGIALFWLISNGTDMRYLRRITGYGVPRLHRLIALGWAVSETATVH